MDEILEITSLRPAVGLTSADFVAANSDIDAYLSRQPGFRWRRIVESANGEIFDIVAYDSLKNAQRGAAGITGEMGSSPVHNTIDHDTVEWRFTTVVHSLDVGQIS